MAAGNEGGVHRKGYPYGQQGSAVRRRGRASTVSLQTTDVGVPPNSGRYDRYRTLLRVSVRRRTRYELLQPHRLLLVEEAGGPTPIAGGVDTGSGTEAQSWTVAITATDTGAGVEAQSVAAAATVTDTGSGAEAQSWTVAITVTDTGTGVDDQTVNTGSGPGPVTDTGSGAESQSIVVAITATETGVGADGVPTSGRTVTDTGAAAEAQSSASSRTQTDTGAGAEAQAWSVAVTVTDTGAGAFGQSVVVSADNRSITVLDIGLSVDVVSARGIGLLDGAVGVEDQSIVFVVRTVTVTDEARGYEFELRDLLGEITALSAYTGATPPMERRGSWESSLVRRMRRGV